MNVFNNKITFLIGAVFVANVSIGQISPTPSSEIYQRLNKLNTIGKVLYIAAHPDDENTRLIAHLTKDENLDVSYLSLTRGDGGQNLIGTEIGQGLGLLRSHELLSARKIDGGHQYFTRAIDFGYSKTAEETLKIWDQEKVLSDMVLVIRKVKPDVIITRFSLEEHPERSTHGHHTASAKLALLAFDYAADPNKYPEQLALYPIHKTQKLYWNTSYWFYGSQELMDEEIAKTPDKYLKINANTFLPLLGKSCSEISALSRSQHKSQGFGSAPVLDEQTELLELLKGESNGNDLFSGVPYRWEDLPNGKAIGKKIELIKSHFNFSAPEQSIEELFALRDLIKAAQNDPKSATYAKEHLPQIDDLIAMCIGLRATAFSSSRKYFVGEEVEVKIDAIAFCNNTTVVIEQWDLFGLHVGLNVINQSIVDSGYHKTFSGRIDENDAYSQPYWLKYDKSLGSYTMPKNPAAVLDDVSPYSFNMKMHLTVNGHAFEYSIPIVYGHTDPVKGQTTQPILITPDVMLNLDQEVYIFTGSSAKTIQVELITGRPELEGYVELNLPEGWKSTPAFYKTKTSFKGEKQSFDFVVSPPANQQSASVRAMFKTNEAVYTIGINELIYDHIPHTAWFPTAQSSLHKIDLQKKGSTIGYLMGAGDKVPEALKEMGYQVTVITVDDVLQKTLTYDAIVIGIRAFNTVDGIESIHAKLMSFIHAGGNLVVQYNTAHRLSTKEIGPYPLQLSRKRVTEEGAGVTLLKPNHPALITPNKLLPSDFENWVQERGLYFPDEWDEHYDAILSMHDEGEEDLTGSLLVTKYGQGYFVYTGLSFFRELPAGVPGAYRLMANLISLGK